MKSEPNIVMGCDPGLAAVGWALIDTSKRRPVCKRAWTQRTPSDWDTPSRLVDIRTELGAFGMSATTFATEDQAPGQIAARKLGATNAKAAIARDVQHQLTAKAEHMDMRVVVLAPRTWRSRLGLTKATDAQIKAWVRRCVDNVPKVLSIHAAEAICIAVAGARGTR